MRYQLGQPVSYLSSSHGFLGQHAFLRRPVARLRVSLAESSIPARRAATMGRSDIGSWFGTRSNGEVARDVEGKKQDRRAFSCSSSASPLKSNINNGGSLCETLSNEKGGGIKCKADRGSVSTMRSVSDLASDTVTAPASGTSDMVALSKKIAEETEKLEKYMRSNGLAMPGFDVGAADEFPKLPEDIQKSRLEIIHATKELRDLAVGPRESVRWGVWEVSSYMPTTSACNFMLMDLPSTLMSWRYK